MVLAHVPSLRRRGPRRRLPRLRGRPVLQTRPRLHPHPRHLAKDLDQVYHLHDGHRARFGSRRRPDPVPRQLEHEMGPGQDATALVNHVQRDGGVRNDAVLWDLVCESVAAGHHRAGGGGDGSTWRRLAVCRDADGGRVAGGSDWVERWVVFELGDDVFWWAS